VCFSLVALSGAHQTESFNALQVFQEVVQLRPLETEVEFAAFGRFDRFLNFESSHMAQIVLCFSSRLEFF
jgi:hypothetical protein